MGFMYTSLSFIRHLLRAKRWDAFHSPWLFELFTFCCDEKLTSPQFEKIEKRRKSLQTSDNVINRIDYGAGSTAIASQRTTIGQIARNALSHPFQCRFLYRLANFHNPQHILEFGTSLGISTAYLSTGCVTTSIDTVEGDPQIAELAKQTFDAVGCHNISLCSMTFQEYIDHYLSGKGLIDIVFLDGHHTSRALLQYYQLLKHQFHPNTILVVDDIYWSEDMNNGWQELIHYPEVTQSVDCFHFGLVFFNDEFIGRENHKIRLPVKMMLT